MSENKVSIVVFLAISVILASFIIPIGIGLMNSMDDMTDWNVVVKLAFTVLTPILFFAMILIAFIPKGKKKHE